MLHRIRFILSVFTLLTSLFTLQAAHAATIQLPQTGQTGCWDINGTTVTCTGTGQDGDKLAGVPLPVPRFTDNSNGTVTDNLTGLIWLKNASSRRYHPTPADRTNRLLGCKRRRHCLQRDRAGWRQKDGGGLAQSALHG